MVAFRIFLSAVLLITWTVCTAGKSPEKSKEEKASDDKKNPLARGWGDSIEWMELEAGQEAAKQQKKPLMLIIHKTWCGACQTLKGKFAKAKMIAELAKKFIMVNAEDDEEPWEEEFSPDGGKYIPRIFFLSPEGDVLKDIINPKDEYKQYPYYYSNPAPIIHAMQNVLKRFSGDGAKKAEKAGEGAADKEQSKEKKEKKEDKEEKEKPDLPDEPKPPSQKPPQKEL